MGGLFITYQPLEYRRYIIAMWAISFFPSVLLSILLAAVVPNIEESMPDFDVPHIHPLAKFVSIVVISPIVETLLMAAGIYLTARVVRSPWRVALVTGVLWGGLHSLMAPAWGLIIWWPFFVFACAWITWRRRSWSAAFGAVAAIHALQNFVPGLLLLLN